MADTTDRFMDAIAELQAVADEVTPDDAAGSFDDSAGSRRGSSIAGSCRGAGACGAESEGGTRALCTGGGAERHA